MLRLRPLVSVVALAGAMLVVAACEGAEEKQAANSDEPIVIGASLPLTGPFSIPGSNHQKGYELCVETINDRGGLLDRQVKLQVSDNRSDPETVVNQVERFISADRVDLLLGTFSTLLSFPASAIAEQNQMVWLEPSDSALSSHGRGLKYNFGFTLKPIEYIGQTPVDALPGLSEAGQIPADELPKTAAIVYQDDFFANGILQGLKGGTMNIPGAKDEVDFGEGYLAENGIELVYEKQFPADFNGWVSLASQIKRSGADYLFVLTVPPSEVNLVRAFETVKYRPKAAFFSQGTYPEFKESLGDGVNGVMVWSTWSPAALWEGTLNGEPYGNQDFVEAYEERFGNPPDEDMAQAFTVCQALAQAVNETESLDNTELRDWFASRTAEEPVETIQGPYHFDDKGLTVDRDVLLLQWQEGELVQIFPTGDEYPDLAEIEWPMPNW